MPVTPLFQTVRITASTRMRAQNMLQTIEAFKESPTMGNSELQILLDYSASGTRKYISDLLRLGLITVVSGGKGRFEEKSRYALTRDLHLIERFEVELKAHIASANVSLTHADAKRAALPEIKKRPSIQQRFPDRHIHLAADDMASGVKIVKNAGEGMRDHLVAALFGPARIPASTLVVKTPVAEVA